MQAFPKDSLNNSIGGSGPLNMRPDHARFMGRGDEEAFKDYAAPAGRDRSGIVFPEPQVQRRRDAPVFDPLARGSILHGDESMGLGTSTFLEGTPAARTAIQRRQAETAQETLQQGLQMQRKKSLAQRIRNINRGGPREFHAAGRMTNPEGVYEPRSADLQGEFPAGESNPFFNEFDKSEDRITVRRADTTRRPSSPSSPVRNMGLERRATTDATSDQGQPRSASNGLLARVKSLKGGRRQRPEPGQPGPSYVPVAPAAGAAV